MRERNNIEEMTRARLKPALPCIFICITEVGRTRFNFFFFFAKLHKNIQGPHAKTDCNTYFWLIQLKCFVMFNSRHMLTILLLC